jgi:hypothetical protein
MVLQFYGALALAGRPAKFDFLFWLGVIGISLQNNSSNLTKECWRKASVVTALERSDWMDEMELVPGLFDVGCGLEKAGAGEMKLGLEIARWKVRNHSCRGVKSGL